MSREIQASTPTVTWPKHPTSIPATRPAGRESRCARLPTGAPGAIPLAGGARTVHLSPEVRSPSPVLSLHSHSPAGSFGHLVGVFHQEPCCAYCVSQERQRDPHHDEERKPGRTRAQWARTQYSSFRWFDVHDVRQRKGIMRLGAVIMRWRCSLLGCHWRRHSHGAVFTAGPDVCGVWLRW